MYAGLPFTGAPLLYLVSGGVFMVSGAIARGIDYYNKKK